jgi:argininosuccinate lyase
LGKGIPTDKQIEQFTVGNDTGFSLAKYDALGSIAHAKMLAALVYKPLAEKNSSCFKRNHR